jgi:hypothetical protein
VIWVSQARRDHFDFVSKMQDRGVEVVELHNLLADTLHDAQAGQWILDRRLSANQVGVGFSDGEESPMRLIIALGDNVLLCRGEAMTAENPRDNVRIAGDQSAKVAVIGSQARIEAMLRGKPALASARSAQA